jgi:hypothetical protein
VLRVARAVQTVPGEADTQSPPDEPVGEGMLREVCHQPAHDYPTRASNPFPTGVPCKRDGAEQSADLDGVALGDRESVPGGDALWSRHISSIILVTGMAVSRLAEEFGSACHPVDDSVRRTWG